MPDVVLGPGEQAALASLLAAEPVPGRPLPERHVLVLLERLIPCDAVVGFFLTPAGDVIESVDVPGGFLARLERRYDEPFTGHGEAVAVGIRHLTRPPCAEDTVAAGIGDSLHIALRNGTDHVVELWFDRTRRRFVDRDVAILSMLSPVLRRLVRERPAAYLPDALTVQERRVLVLVSAGFTNAQIAARLNVASCTVRKHLEHSYRKLGVTSRLGAIAALQGCDRPELDLRARVERFA